MPEQNIGKLARDQVIELSVDAYPGKVFKGKVTSLDARVAQDTRTLLVRGTLPNPDRKLLPGMFANVAVLAGEPAEVVTVPRTAITYSLYGDNVYVVKPEEPKDGKPAEAGEEEPGEEIFVVERRFVRPGQVRGDLVAITSGLKTGEQVVTTGQLKLNNGSRVKIDNSQELKPPAVLPKQ
jgi:membrane fusion protein (multidrug efflux system)